MKSTLILVTVATSFSALVNLAPAAFAQSVDDTNQGWSLLDRNSPLMAGSNFGNQRDLYQGIKNSWNEDPVSQGFEHGINAAADGCKTMFQFWQPQTVTPTANVSTRQGGDYQPAQALNQQRRNQQLQSRLYQPISAPQTTTPAEDLSTPLGRFEYYRPIFEQQAQVLNQQQRDQQLRYARNQ